MPKTKLSQYKVIIYPNPILSKQAEPVSLVNSEIKQFVKDMLAVMYREGGVGLAAPQIGVSSRIFVANPEGKKGGPEFVFINPVMSEHKGEVLGPEGCLSLPGISGDVIRAEQVTIEASNEKGETFRLKADDFLARIIQHENDHLNGKLFIDHVGFTERQKLLAQYESGLVTDSDSASDEGRIFRVL